ncbi:hypothetical protein D3C84_297300 [compost metagenome]
MADIRNRFRLLSSLRPWAILLFSCLIALPVRAADVLLTAADDTPGMQAFTHALAGQRPKDQVRFVPLSELPPPSRIPSSTRLILLDLAALDWRLQDSQGPPTLVLRVSRLQANQRVGDTQPLHLSLLWSDPPLSRQLRLTRNLLPQARRVGVLYGKNSEFLLKELHQAAHQLSLEIVSERWDNTNDSRPLQTLLSNSDVLLGLDDPDLYNPKTAKNLLLSSYGQQLALIGPNAGFVKAGSLASTYSDQSDWLAVLGDLLDRAPVSWPRSLYPNRFKVANNPQVTRSLGIGQIDPAEVATQLAEGEHLP